MKLSDYAKLKGISYRTAWRMWKRKELEAEQLPSGTVIIHENSYSDSLCTKVAIYTRVSSSENQPNLETQAERLTLYCIAKGYQINYVIKEVGSGVNDNRRKLIDLLKTIIL